MKKTSKIKKTAAYIFAILASLAAGALWSLFTAPRGVLSEKAKQASVSPISEIDKVYLAEYAFTGTETTLPIFMAKNASKEIFVSGVKISTREPDDIIKAAEYYYKKKYDEATATKFPDHYEVIFTNRLGKFADRAFPCRAYLDLRGNLLKMEQSEAEYVNLYETKISTPAEAYEKLPLPPTASEEIVTLESCEIVYIYEDSLAQPAYLFKGKTNEGTTFEASVKASKF
jgi:hypothetical protein